MSTEEEAEERAGEAEERVGEMEAILGTGRLQATEPNPITRGIPQLSSGLERKFSER